MTTSPPSWHQSLVAACLSAPEGTFVSHRAAARLWGIDEGNETPLEISTTHDVRRMPDVIVHRVQSWLPCDIESRSIPLTSPERTLLDLAAVIPIDRLELALDDALTRRLTSVHRLHWRLNTVGARGKIHSKALRRLLLQRPVGAAIPESRLETRLLRVISASRLPEPQRQFTVFSGKKVVARVDFAYPKQRVAIEADGYRYHSGRQAWARDLARRNALQGLGWTVLHFTHHQIVARREEVVDLIASALSRAKPGE